VPCNIGAAAGVDASVGTVEKLCMQKKLCRAVAGTVEKLKKHSTLV
jgi:hypothetical protein